MNKKIKKYKIIFVYIWIISSSSFSNYDSTLGLPLLKIPKNNPITEEKIELGKMLFNDARFSSDGSISCASCHNPENTYTDGPLRFSRGVNGQMGTINTPTIINAAYYVNQFRDERSPDLEDQALHPLLNPLEMGLKSYQPILNIVQDPHEPYRDLFKKAFNVTGKQITMKHVTAAIATFERTLIAGNSRFDRWYFLGEETLSPKEKMGFKIFMDKGKCVACHTVEKTSALFTDNKVHNVGVGINLLDSHELEKISQELLRAQFEHRKTDSKILKDPKTTHLGKFAVIRRLQDLGAFKTPNLRNIELTAPYMHDGSINTLEDVVEHYNRGGASSEKEKINPFISSGIRPLNLDQEEKESLVAFLKTLTSSRFRK